MGLTSRSCRLGGTISARMKRWQLSGATVVCVIGLPAFGLCGVESARHGRRHHRTVCRLSRQSNSDKTHLATGCLIPSFLLTFEYISAKLTPTFFALPCNAEAIFAKILSCSAVSTSDEIRIGSNRHITFSGPIKS